MFRSLPVALVLITFKGTILIQSSQVLSPAGPSQVLPPAGQSRTRKDVASYSEEDIERLYEEWETNDPEKDDHDIDDGEAKKRERVAVDLKKLGSRPENPEQLLKLSKKGETLMMFVSVRDPQVPSKKDRLYTEKMTELWHSMLRNNHIQSRVFLIDDDRAIFMFPDGSQAFEAKDFLIKQLEITEITLEGRQYNGAGAARKEEL